MIIKVPIYMEVEGRFTPQQSEELIDQLTFLTEKDLQTLLGKKRLFNWKVLIPEKEPISTIKFLTRQEVNERILPKEVKKKEKPEKGEKEFFDSFRKPLL